jgi:hypothetical protein
VVVVAGVHLGISGLGGANCAGTVRLAVAAAPDVAAAVRAAADAWTGANAKVDGACVRIDVQAADPAEVTAALSARRRGTATGAPGPQVWIPDAGTWLQRLRSAAPTVEFTEEGSVALSPVVMAMPEPVAKKLGWPDRTPSYADLLRLVTTSTTTRAGTVDPTRDATALSGLLALGAAATAADQRRPGTSNGLLRALATGTSVLRDDLMAQLPQDDDDASLAAGLGLAAMSESDVITFNATKPAVSLAALYLRPQPLPLDYPFAVLPSASAEQAEAARAFYTELNTAGFAGRLGAGGLRAPDGTAPAGFVKPKAAPGRIATATAGSGEAAAAEADSATIDRTLAGWSAVVAPARMLAIIDASASMRTPVPTARNATRMRLTLAAARGGLGLFSDEWSVGLWEFAAGRQGGDHRELVPIRPLTGNRDAVADALAGITPGGGEAGLFRTILDGYRNVQNGWEAGRVNSVVVLTDGVGAGAAGDLELADLLRRLKDAKAADKPVQVIVLGVGTSVDRKPLEQITQVTGGGVFIAEDPAQVGAVFLDALSLRTTAPR